MAPSGIAGSALGEGSVVAGTYEITGVLGRGGMGAVWAARHLRLPGKRVAIKVLLPGTGDAQVLARFQREAEIVSRIGHPGIVEVLDFNLLDDGSPYQVLEYLDGESLGARLRQGPIPLPEALAITRQIGSALAAAHRAGVVHRDLKPENIFLCPTDAGGVVDVRVKVLDFGISKIRGSATVTTQDSVLIGTPQYMAPEQAAGQNRTVDHRADVFALAAIVYEMLSGRPAFSGDDLLAVIMNVLTGTPTPLATVVPGTPATVVAAIERGLAKSPDDRFSDVGAFVAALTGRPLETLDGKGVPSGVRAVVAGGASDASVEALGETIASGERTAPPAAAATSPAAAPTRWLGVVAGLAVAGAIAAVVGLGARGPTPAPPTVTEAPKPTPVAPKAPASIEPAAPTPPSPPPAVATAVAPPPPEKPGKASARGRAELDPALASELAEAEAALAAGNVKEAKRKAQHALLTAAHPRVYAVLLRAACRERDLTAARAHLGNVARSERKALVRACAADGLDLR